MLLIGSHALLHHNVKLDRDPADFDIIATYEEYKDFINQRREYLACYYPLSGKKMFAQYNDGQITEFEIAWPGSTAETLLELTLGLEVPSGGYLGFYGLPNMKIATLDEIYTLKMSHRYLRNSPHFMKTRRDIMKLSELGAVIPSHLLDWYAQREAETYDYKHPKLNQGKKEFFTDSVKYIYDHDSIHEAIKVGARPAYQAFKPDTCEVMCSREMFEELPLEQRLLAVYEESMVLALERSLIPYAFSVRPRDAFEMALMKVCTSITSGWFREFAYEHYDEVLNLFLKDKDVIFRFMEGLRTGIIVPHR